MKAQLPVILAKKEQPIRLCIMSDAQVRYTSVRMFGSAYDGNQKGLIILHFGYINSQEERNLSTSHW